LQRKRGCVAFPEAVVEEVEAAEADELDTLN
jgi:hypothetical protein